MGEHTVEVSKPGYTTLTQTVTINEGQTANLNVEFEEVHSDDDGMSDNNEAGYIDQFGNLHSSDPYKADTDNDGRNDGEEAGTLITDLNGHSFWQVSGDALKIDTDGDGASDYVETILFGTDPLVGAIDLAPEIIYHQSISIHNDAIHLKTYGKMGGVFGETGIKDGSMNWLVGDNVASSLPYFIGWMASGYVAVGDVRDTIETIYQGDGAGTVFNGAAFLPYIGDGSKTVNSLRKVTTKYPSKARDLGILLSRDVVGYLPNDYIKRQVWELTLNARENAIIAKLFSEGKSGDEILGMVKSEKGLVKEYLAKKIDDFNNLPNIENKFSASKDTTVIGKYIDDNDALSYQNIAKIKGANYLQFADNPGWDINKEFLDLADINGKIKCCSNPSEASGGFLDEINYLEGKGYDVGTDYYETINGVTYHFWDMVKV